MPLNLSSDDRRLIIVAGVLFLVSALLALFLSPAESNAQFATSYSTASEGAKAAYLLLRESGYQVERWSRPPSELTDALDSLLIIADPMEVPEQADRAAIGKFLNDGGEVVIAGSLSPLFATEIAPTPVPLSLGWQKFTAQTLCPQALNAHDIQLEPIAVWPKPSPGIGLYGNTTQFTVMQYPHGKGSLLWLASSSLLSNAGLREPGNLEFLLSTVGSKSRRVLWDEYFHGHRSEAIVAKAHPQVAWLLAQTGFIAVAVLLTFSRRSGPRRPPRQESRLSPLEYVRALGQLYERARAASVAVDVAYERFRYAASNKLGLAPAVSTDELAHAIAERWSVDREDLRSLLDSCESARFYEDLDRKEALALVQRLHKYSQFLKLFPEPTEEGR